MKRNEAHRREIAKDERNVRDPGVREGEKDEHGAKCTLSMYLPSPSLSSPLLARVHTHTHTSNAHGGHSQWENEYSVCSLGSSLL